MEQIKRTQKVFKHCGLIFLAVFFTVAANYLYYSSMPRAVAQETVPVSMTKAPESPIVITEVPIIVFHNISPDEKISNKYNIFPEEFEKKIAYIKENGYQPISFADLEDGFSSAKKPIIISFDDGWQSQFIYALPILKKYDFTATFFIVSDYLDKKEFMNAAEIKELSDAGFEIGAHSQSHAYLTGINSQQLRDELTQSKMTLEKIMGKEISAFAYPYGLNNGSVRSAAEAAGYKMARTVSAGVYQTGGENFKLPANIIYADTDIGKIISY